MIWKVLVKSVTSQTMIAGDKHIGEILEIMWCSIFFLISIKIKANKQYTSYNILFVYYLL